MVYCPVDPVEIFCEALKLKISSCCFCLQSPARDTDCASAVDDGVGDAQNGCDMEQRDDGYLSGAESDSGLVDTRQSINLVVKNLQVCLSGPLKHFFF